jgi:proteic killer suppression protein
MIQSFKCKETAKVFEAGFSQKFPAGILKSAIIRLAILNRSGKLDDLKVPPSNHLEKLSRDREGQYSIIINDKYRVCFRWQENNAYDVEIVYYH